jgi:hypothetical protein
MTDHRAKMLEASVLDITFGSFINLVNFRAYVNVKYWKKIQKKHID